MQSLRGVIALVSPVSMRRQIVRSETGKIAGDLIGTVVTFCGVGGLETAVTSPSLSHAGDAVFPSCPIILENRGCVVYPSQKVLGRTTRRLDPKF